MTQRLFILAFLGTIATTSINAQLPDSAKNERLSIHAQTTIVDQYKPSFQAQYSGENSLRPEQESQTSITSSLFVGARLWKGASVFINPEIAGGSGLSETLGIAAATNGETFRVGNPAPTIYVARLFFRQLFPLTLETLYQESNFNQLGQRLPTRFVAVTIGKVGAADYFDDNQYSHDPRTQFLSWALMSNGAWDYPANTRGYTPSLVVEWITPHQEWRYGLSLVPYEANGNHMNWNITKASAHTLEYTHRHTVRGREGAVRLLGFFNTANMGNYRQSLALDPQQPVIENTRKYGTTKFGFGLNAEQDFSDVLGGFLRASWNDGQHESWMFTEIDRSISAGLSLAGLHWKRSNDHIGLAYVVSALSGPHRDYLKAGGLGFMLGDGNLNYSREHLAEGYYSAELVKQHIYLTGTYQILVNPAYNTDRRGPVHVLSVRLHARI